MSAGLRSRPAWVLAAGGAVALGTILRVALSLRSRLPSPMWLGDERIYLDVAKGLARGEIVPDAWIWTPGYPALGVLFSLGGDLAVGLHAASLLLGITGPVILLLFASRSAARRATAFAAAVLALYPEAILAAARPLTESAGMGIIVAALVLSEIARAKHAVAWSALAGAVGGLAVLIRPEAVFAMVPLALTAWPRRGLRPAVRDAALRRVAVRLLVLALVVGPQVGGLRAASGVWGLSLKPHLNLLKKSVYAEETDYLAKRRRWNEVRPRWMHDDGTWDPRRLAAAIAPARTLAKVNVPGFWIHEAREGLANARWDLLALLPTGLLGIGLAARRPGRRRLALLAGISLLPFLPTPLFALPFGRFCLSLAPGLAWGAGSLLDELLERLPRRRAVRLAGGTALWAGGAAAAVLGAGLVTEPDSFPKYWTEVLVMVEDGDLETADSFTASWARAEAENGRVRMARAHVLAERGDAEGAAREGLAAVAAGLPLTELVSQLLRLGNVEAARGVLDRAPAEGGGDAGSEEAAVRWRLRGTLEARSEHWEEASEAFHRALELDDEAPGVHSDYAACLVRLGRLGEAIGHYDIEAGRGEGELAARAATMRRRIEELIASDEAPPAVGGSAP